MFRSISPFDNDSSSYAGSTLSNGYSTTDEVSSQVSGLSKPSAKSVYSVQRKEYAASMNKMMDKFQYKVEHLFTCDLDGRQLRSVADCVERLKLLDRMGRVWGQSMLLEVHGAHLLLTDTETKEELETLALSDILELKAVLDPGAFNSLLIVSAQPRNKNTTAVFMFQCEDVRADYVQRDLSRALSHRRHNPSSSSTGLIVGHESMKNLHNPATTPEPEKQWAAADYEEDGMFEPQEEQEQEEEEQSSQPFLPPTRPYTELDRNVDILNHVLNDIEIFTGQVMEAAAKNSKKKKKKKGGKDVDDMPSAGEFAGCFQKTKYAFNLLGELNGKIHNPSAPDIVHSLFSTLAFVVPHCSKDLPPTIVAPLLTPQCIRVMSEEASSEEDQLWQSLGDPWNIPSTKWPEDDEDIPTYAPDFTDGWQPPAVTSAPAVLEPVSTKGRPQPAPITQRDSSTDGQASADWTPPHEAQKPCSGESSLCCMRVMYDFISRNHRELSIRKGEVVELLDMSRQWWKVRNSRGEVGYVPNNVLKDHEDQPNEQTGGSPVLTKQSKPADVKAWLEDKGFSKITVRCLGVLSGSMLLGMTREELKTVCPEEGGRVFFQLQAVRSAMDATS
ncbi:epidermal growth factor receptor kinase substrate 8 isoform X1 [Mastacembelus armatus]|uniref:epidermal growth factor receptor kinase substrate 8 isoform X1 n=1 Tax=Mastacembelus armatus TaxID=205130 RepID=UPI000E464945|nr:epidermal growth factor receptor kinase substrate 8-like isoform X1 [Mastacembelus armatus]